MPAFKEFANFLTLNMANLAATYARLLVEAGGGYNKVSIDSRLASGRKLLKAIVESCESGTPEPLARLFGGPPDPSLRWTAGTIDSPNPLLEIECLGQTLNPIVTDLDAGKFVWQTLSEVRAAILKEASPPTPTNLVDVSQVGEERTNLITSPHVRLEDPPGENETLYQSLVDSLPQKVYRVDREGRIVFGNEAFLDELGMTLDEGLGKTTYELYPKELADKYRADDSYVLQTGELFETVEAHQVPVTGDMIYVQVVKKPVRDPTGKITGIQGIYWDVTESKLAEQALQESRERFELAMAGSNDGLWDWNILTNAVYFSPRWKSMIGYQDSELPNDFAVFEDHLHPEDHDWVMSTVTAYLEGRLSDFEPEFRFRHKDGSYRWILARGAVVRDEAGQPTRMAGSHMDITQRKRAEALLAKRASELEAVAEVSTAAATVLEVDRLLQDVADLTKGRFGLYHAHIYLLDETGDTLELAAGADSVGRQMVAQEWAIPLDREQSLVARAARTGEGVIVNDVQSEPDWLPNPLLPDTHSEMAVPMMIGGRVLGVLDVQADVVDRFTAEDVRIKTTLAAQIAVALENANQHQRMKSVLAEVEASRALLQTIIDSTPDWIFVKDQQHCYRLVNQGYAKSLDMPPEEFVGKTDLDIGFPEEIVKGNAEKGIRGFWADDREVMERGESKFIDVEPAEIDGQPAYLSTIKAPLRHANGEVWGVLGYVRNITEQHRLLAETESLYRSSQAISLARSEYEVARALVEHVDRTNLDRVSVALVTSADDDNIEMEIKGVWDRAGREEQSAGRVLTSSEIPLIATLAPQDVLEIDDLETSNSLDDVSRTTFKRMGVQSAAIVPVSSGQHLYGWLLLEAIRTPWEAALEIRPYISLAQQAAIVLESHRLLAEAQRRAYREQTIREITDKMRAATSLEQLVTTAAEELGHRFSVDYALVKLGIDTNGHVSEDKTRSER